MNVQLPPGPKGHFLLGNMREFTRNSLGFMREITQYGDIAAFKFGPFPVYIVQSPEYIHDVMVENADKYHKSRVTKQALKEAIGTGIFTSDGDFWKRQRKLVQPAFHTKRIGAYAQVMVDYALALADRWGQGGTFDVDHEMTNLTMNIVAKTLFDADVSGDAQHVGEAMTKVLSLANERFNTLLPIPTWIPTRSNRELMEAVGQLDTMIHCFISERRASGDDKGDLLSMLLMAQDEDANSMSDKQVRDEAMTLFGAGHETTAVALTWTWYLLSQHPEIEAKLMEELDRVLAGRTPTLADLPQLQYTEMIIKESMRMFPPAWGTSREAIEPIALGSYNLKKGDTVLINIYGMHYDERFFKNAEQFQPERFSLENEKLIPKYAYIPFGSGPRVCIGNSFAMMESKVILATLAQRFHLALAPGHQVVPERVFTLRPKYGMRMMVEAREQIPEVQ